MNMVQTQIPNTPLLLSMLEDSSIAISLTENIGKKVLIDYVGNLEVLINCEGIFTKDGEGAIMQYLFNTRYFYKEEPNLLKWLQSFNLG
jgi:hypothetical protein